jgi:hypothetical protein
VKLRLTQPQVELEAWAELGKNESAKCYQTLSQLFLDVACQIRTEKLKGAMR